MMKRLMFSIPVIAAWALFFTNAVQVQAQSVKPVNAGKTVDKKSAGKTLKMVTEHKGPVISAGHPDVVASGNRSGFETGQVVKGTLTVIYTARTRINNKNFYSIGKCSLAWQ